MYKYGQRKLCQGGDNLRIGMLINHIKALPNYTMQTGKYLGLQNICVFNDINML